MVTSNFQNQVKKLVGFRLSDFSSPSRLMELLNRPTDPASLGMVRVLFGFLMLLDIPQERGLGYADEKWGNTDMCHFPLFNFMKAPSLVWMYAMYCTMWVGAFLLMVGLFYRIGCLMFSLSFWYLFFLDKTKWNNHSYLYGLHGIMFTLMDANRYWSLDGMLKPKIKNSHVPLWNYTLLRAQNFLVYFLAGLKKFNPEWLEGYSMKSLNEHWVFMPFKFILTPDQVDLFVVHYFGFVLDLTIGFFLFFDVTRPYAMLFGISFHFMNSQIFNIGMFPWTMIATITVFLYTDWPRKAFKKLPYDFLWIFPVDEPIQQSPHCIYSTEETCSSGQVLEPTSTMQEESSSHSPAKKDSKKKKYSAYHVASTIFTILYLAVQCFLPYSHFITKGYNNWTNGLYGYSWDMMVHRWNIQHIQITYVQKDTGETGYLDPLAFVRSERRWPLHADMVKQYATCIEERLNKYGLKNIELYFDIWISMTKRFQQRIFDPKTDILHAEWSPFQKTKWILPLQAQLSDWRRKMDKITKAIQKRNPEREVTFILDFPGYHLENFITDDLVHSHLTVLRGSVIVEIVNQMKNYTLKKGDKMKVPSGEFHIVYTVSDVPAGYMYTYVNQTEWNMNTATCIRPRWYERPFSIMPNQGSSNLEKFFYFLKLKYYIFSRSLTLSFGAIQSLISGQPFEQILNETYQYEDKNVDRTVIQSLKYF